MLTPMKPRLVSLLLLLTAPLWPAAAAEKAPVAPPPIFNGQDLTGWKADASRGFWRVENGILVGENDEKLKGNMLWTERDYGDFVFECEVRWTGDIDSGVLFRKPDLQLQFGTSSSLKKDMTGCFYTGGKPAYPEAGLAHLDAPFNSDQWNKFRIEARGTTFTVWLNGKQISQLTDPKFVGPAPIGLQVHPNKKMRVEYRNIRAADLR
jgi:hypothetical protein